MWNNGYDDRLGLLQRRRNRGGNGGARPRNAENARAKVSFRLRNNMSRSSALLLVTRKSVSLYSFKILLRSSFTYCKNVVTK